MNDAQPLRPGRETAVLLGLAALAALRFSEAVSGWFIYDDPHAMISSTRSLREIFFSRHYSYWYYTPLVALSFMPDTLMVGLNPVPYHIHNVVLVVGLAGATSICDGRPPPARDGFRRARPSSPAS